MDETKTVAMDAKQTLPSATPSDGKTGSTSQATPTFTEEQVKAREQKAVSDALAKAGRETKTLETARNALEKDKADLAKWKQEKEDAELDSIAEATPEQKQELKAYKAKLREKAQAIAEREKALAAKEVEWGGKITEAETTKFEVSVYTIAAKNNVSAELLKDWAAKYNISDMELIEDRAALMPKKVVIPVPDTGKTTGGGTTPEKARDKISAGFAALHK